MWLPDGFKLDQEGKYYAQIIGDRPISITDADRLFEDGYQLISMDHRYAGILTYKPVFTISIFKWREAKKCGS